MLPPPDFSLRVYSPQRIAAVIDTLAEDGADARLALEGSDLQEADLRSASTRVSYAQAATVFRNALQLSARPALAIRAGRRMHITSYGMYGYALLSSRVCSEWLDFSTRYVRVIGPLADMRFDPDNAPGACRYEPLICTDPGDALYRFALDFTYAAHLTLAQDLWGRAFQFTEVLLTTPCPADAAEAALCSELLGCAIHYGQPANEVRFDPAWLGRSPPMHDPITHAMAQQMCQQFLADLPQSGGTAAAVRKALVEQMPWRFPNLEAMARELQLEPRTLRRRLEAQGTTYREILADVRRTLAENYLRRTRMTTEDIANRLGYSEAANFRHAFVRWTGKTPHEFRS